MSLAGPPFTLAQSPNYGHDDNVSAGGSPASTRWAFIRLTSAREQTTQSRSSTDSRRSCRSPKISQRVLICFHPPSRREGIDEELEPYHIEHGPQSGVALPHRFYGCCIVYDAFKLEASLARKCGDDSSTADTMEFIARGVEGSCLQTKRIVEIGSLGRRFGADTVQPLIVVQVGQMNVVWGDANNWPCPSISQGAHVHQDRWFIPYC